MAFSIAVAGPNMGAPSDSKPKVDFCRFSKSRYSVEIWCQPCPENERISERTSQTRFGDFSMSLVEIGMRLFGRKTRVKIDPKSKIAEITSQTRSGAISIFRSDERKKKHKSVVVRRQMIGMLFCIFPELLCRVFFRGVRKSWLPKKSLQ